jgi:beta-phosphoglucomutase-like phosphatase (HAD superfamily)
MTRQGVLWDLDGVLVDTGEFHFQAWSGLLPEYGVPFTRELFRATFGMNNGSGYCRRTAGRSSHGHIPTLAG